jgi:predicted AlkP superfamily pyrophosphatase or phosphodiesterase
VGRQPVVPDYDGAAVNNVVPALLGQFDRSPPWLPSVASGADQVVLLVLDGLGWDQLQERLPSAPTLASLDGGSICTVAPSTTAAALTSIATGLPPGQHGIVGYRMAVDDRILNVLRWATPSGDARPTIPPESIQAALPFEGERPPVVTRAEFAQSGFTLAHLAGTRLTPYRMVSTLVTEVRRLLGKGEPFVYAYYEGIDKVAHEYGLDEHYDSELRWVDHLVSELLATLPTGTCLALTADHGQVEVGSNTIELDPGIRDHLSMQSGEGRFRWLHARPGRARPLLEAAEAHADTGWVASREQIIDEGWFGPKIDQVVRNRLGDVALLARDDVSYIDAADTGPYELIGRHGSLTEAEMLVPFIAATA